MDLHNICIVQAGKITSTTVNHSQQQRQRTVGAPTCVVALMTLLATLERAAGVVEEEFACQQVPPSGSPDIQVNLESNYILNYLSAVLFFFAWQHWHSVFSEAVALLCENSAQM